MKQDIEKQYDDDLTLGADEYDDSYYTDADDLFDLSTDNESPISRLKSLVLSIDWEITDEVLLQFNEELIDLKGIWAGNSINLVYVQALEKLSKYIYQNKANSHPNAIKLLLTLYYNLEKIESSDELTEPQKKEILLEDVRRFEALKRQISQKTASDQSPPPVHPREAKVVKQAGPEDILLNLKAIVLGIDWEITDQDLNNLRREVFLLEKKYAASKPKLILLQGIGTLGAYIKTKKSNAHADAFKVLHLFYESLEKIIKTPMSLEEEKAILFPAVGKFNEFKALLGSTISSEPVDREEDEEEDEEFGESGSGPIAPALADVPDEAIGFQAEEEARSLGLDSAEGVSSHLDSFFGERVPQPVAEERDDSSGGFSPGLAVEEKTVAAVLPGVDKKVALQGVDVEADDEEEDSDNFEAGVTALADAEDGAVSEWQEPSGQAPGSEALATEGRHLTEIASAADSLFPDAEVSAPKNEYGGIDREVALQGVNVETEADEDSDEISLPMEGERVAPALVATEEESLFSAKVLETSITGDIREEIAGTLDDLFLDEEQVPGFVALETAVSEGLMSESREEELEKAAGASAEVPATSDGQPASLTAEVAKQADEPAANPEGNDVDLFFAGDDLEQSVEANAAVDAFFETLEEQPEQPVQEIPAAAADEVPPVAEEGSTPAEEDFWVTEALSPDVELFDEKAQATIDSTALPEEEMAEEDVVFELADGETQPAVDSEVAPILEAPEPVFTPEPVSAFADEATAEQTEPVGEEETQVVDAMPFAGLETEIPVGPLTGLQGCIESLGIELNDTIINGLFEEIDQLRQKWSNRPLEKTFLQLLSTILHHIDRCRFEASSEAHSLLNSVYTALAARREDDVLYNQELLLGETQKVLEWQQGMLTRRAVQAGQELTAAAPMQKEEGEIDAQQDIAQLLQEYQETETAGSAGDEPFEVKTGPQPGPARELLAAELKAEIDTLRKTLQQEIAELRSELKGR